MLGFTQCGLCLCRIITPSSTPRLADCNVNEAWLKHLAVGLRFPDMPLRHLDLSNNDLKDSGVKLLCEGLSSQCCRLEALRYFLLPLIIQSTIIQGTGFFINTS